MRQFNVCAFAGMANEKATHPREKLFTCCHGVTLRGETARRVLGLKVVKLDTITTVESDYVSDLEE